MLFSKLDQTTGSHRNSFGLYITEELVGRKGKKLFALCLWESQNDSMSSPACPWWSGESSSEAQSTQAGLCFPLPSGGASGYGGSLGTDMLIGLKCPLKASPYEASLTLHLDTCFWTHVFHLKTRRLKNASGSLEGAREGRDRGCSFSSIRILEPVL